jgi:hypothetical protein
MNIPFISCNFFFRLQRHFSLLVGPINRTNGGWWLNATSPTFDFAVLRLGVVSQDLSFMFQ